LSKTENNVLIPMLSVRRPLLVLLSLVFVPLRGFSQNVPPVITNPILDATLFRGGSAEVIPLTDDFSDPDTTALRLTTVLGDIDIALYDQRTPITVANFLQYINEGRYFPIDPTTQKVAPLFFHRSLPGFLIQSGGWVATVLSSSPSTASPTQVLNFGEIQNEPGISNTRGTIAMAKIDGFPDSATSEWFINLADNGGPPNNLDTTNGGSTVFARVFGDGMTVADAIAAVPRFPEGAPFDSLPLLNYTVDDFNKHHPITPANLVTIPGISFIPSLSFTAASDHPELASVVISGTDLLVTPQQLGTATITVTATDVDGASVSQSFDVTVVANPARLANISTRAIVGTQDDALIGGFIVLGDTAKRVAVRALGPSLSGAGLTNVLNDPTLELHDGTGALLSFNDNWQDAPNEQEIIDAQLAPTQPNESVILTSLPATASGEAYTAVIHGAGGSSGIGLVEVYDLDLGPGSSILNISTRGQVQTGQDVMIGGLIIVGEGSQRVLVRALGPSLAGAGITNPLADPTLTLYDGQGTQIDFNDNWQDNPAAADIEATTIPPTDPKESAVLQTLAPGGYTAIVRGTGAAPTGTGLVEVYALPPVTAKN
jgi:cyclophilin family peptidyl-prolyl cis-trans isomerase